MKRSFLMMCPLLFSCIAGGYATAETCDYIVTDENLQQVAFFDKKPVSLCFTASVDRFVTGSYKDWSVSLEKGNKLREPPEIETEPEQAAVAEPQQTTAAPQPPEVEENTEADQTVEEPTAESTQSPTASDEDETTAAEQQPPDEEVSVLTGEPEEDHAAESNTQHQVPEESQAAAGEPQEEKASTETAEPAEGHAAESNTPPPVAGQPKEAAADEHTIASEPESATEEHSVEEKADAGEHAEGHAPQSASASQTLDESTPLQKGIVTQPKHGKGPVVPQSSWVELEQNEPHGAEDAHPEVQAEHPAADAPAEEAPADEAHPVEDETVAAEHAGQPASTGTDKAGDLVPLQRGSVSLPEGKASVPQSRWVEVEQHDPATPPASHSEEKDEHPATVADTAATVEEHMADDQPEHAAPHIEPEIVEQPAGQDKLETTVDAQQQEQEKAEPTAGEQPSVTAEEPVAAEQETTVEAKLQEQEEAEPIAGEQTAVAAEKPADTEQEQTVAEQGKPAAQMQFPYEDRLLVTPTDKGARDTLLFAYVEGKTVPIIIQLKNNME